MSRPPWTILALPTSMRLSPTTPVIRQISSAMTLALFLGILPTIACAQQTDNTPSLKAGTVLHTVRPGDTLFDLARRYLGNPFRWPELFRANSSQIANANLIFPGQKLHVGADGRPTFSPDVGALAGPDTAATPARAVPLGRSIAGQSVSVLENSTLTGRTLRPTVRQGEMAAAPFLIPSRSRLTGGELVARADPTVVSAATLRDQFLLFDEVDVLLPPGIHATGGQKFVVYQLGPEVRYGPVRSRVVRPAGVVQVVALGTGRAARARVTAMYGNLKRGDILVAMDSTPSPGTVRPQAVTDGPVYEVAYVDGGVVLPTLQNYVVIALPKGATSRVGDIFELLADGSALTQGRGDTAPANDVAQASVVKVTSEGATAVIVGHQQPAVRAGMRARLISRMP